KMRAGMGDVVFAPLYEVLRRRGVRFEFFHRIIDVATSPQCNAVESITVGRQATVRRGEYQPLVDVGGLPCWPDRPLYDQLVEAGELAASGASLEASRPSWPDVEVRVLQRGRDFDRVVLGIPIAALPSVCPEIIERLPDWRRMVEGVRTVPT